MPNSRRPAPALSGQPLRDNRAARGAESSSAKVFFPGLESLRGLAILLVVLFHYKGHIFGDKALPDSASWLWAPIYAGSSGVTLFFVLSGFLLSLPFLRERLGGRRVHVGRYAVARILRIVPLYYLAVLVAWLTVGNPASAVKALLFFPFGFELFPFNVPWWSLSTEAQFYVLLPLCALLARSSAGRWLLLAGFGLWLASYVNLYRQHHWMFSLETLVWRNSLFGRAPSFLAGVLAAWIYLRRLDERGPPTAWSQLAMPAAAVLALFALWTWTARMEVLVADAILPPRHALEGAAWAVIVLAAAQARTAQVAGPSPLAVLRRGIGAVVGAVLGHLGRISFSLFLVHVPLQFYAMYEHLGSSGGASPDGPGPDVPFLVASTAVASWLLALACHWAVEVPSRRLKERLFPA